ncbi:unnamed protein product [Durusdinium trenchii]|uniref:Uncharacterized protein n=1 Tax=Durusdinium trenchii TaxID=1381693 RepID=A0ABP0JW22_9DINO
MRWLLGRGVEGGVLSQRVAKGLLQSRRVEGVFSCRVEICWFLSRTVNISPEELRKISFSAAEVHDSGLTLQELRTAGYSDSGYEGVSFFLARDQGGLLSTPTTSISGSPGACQLAQQREQNPGTYTISDGTPCDAWKLIQTTWPNCE